MAREIDLSNGLDSLSEEDLAYLRDRGRLTPDQERELLGGIEPNPPEARPLSETPNTGDTGPEDEEQEDGLDPEEYEDASNERLRQELRSRGLSTSGNKQELIDRLESDDEG